MDDVGCEAVSVTVEVVDILRNDGRNGDQQDDEEQVGRTRGSFRRFGVLIEQHAVKANQPVKIQTLVTESGLISFFSIMIF